MSGIFLPGEDPTQVGVIAEADAEHVIALPLAPLGPGPDIRHGIDFKGGVRLDARGVNRRIEKSFHGQPAFVRIAHQQIHHRESSLGLDRVTEIIHAQDIAEKIVFAIRIVTEEPHHFMQLRGRHD